MERVYGPAAGDSGRIALFIPSMAPGGIQVATALLAEGLCDRGRDVDLILADGAIPFTRDIDPRVRVVDLAAGKLRNSVLPLSRYLRETSPAALIVGPDTAALVAVQARRVARSRCVVVTVIHTSIESRTAMERNWKAQAIRLLDRRLLGRSGPVVAVSDGIRQELYSKFRVPNHRLFMIPNALNMTSIREKSKEMVRHDYLDQSGVMIIVAAGRLATSKDYPTMLRAFALLSKEVDARLLILGEGPERARLLSIIDRLGISDRVDLVGHVVNPYAYFARADLFVHSSIYEGAPIVLTEALACGLPVVASDCPVGSSEMLGYGKFGVVVPVGDHRALADAMRRVLESGKHTECRDWLNDRSVEQIVDKYLCLIAYSTRPRAAGSSTPVDPSQQPSPQNRGSTQ